MKKLPVKHPTKEELEEARRLTLTKAELLHIIETALDLALELREQSKKNPKTVANITEMTLLAKAENIAYYIKEKDG